MRDEGDHTTATVESEQEATRDLVEESPLPSLWGSVCQAFQQARLARLEARLRRLRRYAVSPPVACPQPVVILAAERDHRHLDSAWIPVFPTGPRRRLVLLCLIVLVALGGFALSQLPLRTSAITAATATTAPPESQEVTAPGAAEALHITVETQEERVRALRQQLDQQDDHLTNQSSALESVSQQSDTHQTQLTTLTEAMAALSTQVQQVEQQLTMHATRVAAHERQLARQATQLSQWREPNGVSPSAAVDPARSGPPTLELLAPPATMMTAPMSHATPAASAGAGALATGPTPRRTITLPASLGAVGLRTTTKTTGGQQP